MAETSDVGEGDHYGLSPEKKHRTIDPPQIDYLPPRPSSYNPPIALIGTGGISEFHLKAYRALGLQVVALHNRTRSRAEARRGCGIVPNFQK